MVAAAMTPIINRMIIWPSPKVMEASVLLSPSTIFRPTTSAKARTKAIAPAAPFFSPFIFLRIIGRPPRIRPINAMFVGSGYEPSRNVISLARPKMPSTMPSAYGQSILTQRLKSLNSELMQPMIVS